MFLPGELRWGQELNHPEQLLSLDNKIMFIGKHEFLARLKAVLHNESSTVEQHSVDNTAGENAQIQPNPKGENAQTWMK